MTMLCAGQSWNQIVEDMECSRATVKPAKRFKEASGAQSTPPQPRHVTQLTFLTGGMVHEPSMIEGSLSFGQ